MYFVLSLFDLDVGWKSGPKRTVSTLLSSEAPSSSSNVSTNMVFSLKAFCLIRVERNFFNQFEPNFIFVSCASLSIYNAIIRTDHFIALFKTYIRRIEHKLRYIVASNILVQLLGIDYLCASLLVARNVLKGHEWIMLSSVLVNIHLLVAIARIILLIGLPSDAFSLQEIYNVLSINIGLVIFFCTLGRSANHCNLKKAIS